MLKSPGARRAQALIPSDPPDIGRAHRPPLGDEELQIQLVESAEDFKTKGLDHQRQAYGAKVPHATDKLSGVTFLDAGLIIKL
jgi:hypothetical protein